MLTRLFGNKNQTNKPWATLEENGVGKFADIDDKALSAIKALGVTHIWYTGVPHHALITDYTEYGITVDDPDVVKGRAGSPYAVKDYYNVNPDLALDPSKRLQEWQALIERTHRHGMKVLMDIVPNHVARDYQSLSKPQGVKDFGADDDKTVEYAKHNNFYYIPGEAFQTPDPLPGFEPLGGETHPLSDGKFDEMPAKWTGNGSRAAKPHADDWYETVKINYGVKPDGSYDFPKLPAEYAQKDCDAHLAFWQQQDLPDAWHKFKDIALYWLDKGVDGFRYDVAELVPVEFWSFMNCSIKAVNPEAFLLAEIYTPPIYRDYLHLGKMGYIYDKVGTYDALRAVVEGKADTTPLPDLAKSLLDIQQHMLMFLENHDEQRIASPQFAGDADRARPAMVVTATVNAGPTMIYFGQEVGEPGEGDAGFGKASRTTIFDYWGVPAHQRWMNDGAFDGGMLSDKDKSLRDFYSRLLNIAKSESALTGDYIDLHTPNLSTPGYEGNLYAFARHQGDERLLVVANFDEQVHDFELVLPAEAVSKMAIDEGVWRLNELLYGKQNASLKVQDGQGAVSLSLKPLESVIFKL
ncbi:alpha-amylase family glycosyl hydrolase [Aliiglaciecola sp. CAU 1673]|uniref:alpha-amylase family glycosyl hydrolase n=1 Tax=Aliiglaciecola sp. CAU 1673 TaxID=3032595 RepID=UPI0023DC7C94|nr:alpha-amylase family glycosyl hydrolase [Aliiglaciecola sp. CAU 1673]MDF2179032.1 alpha-amylase family glycosyl hydrolase [Aliiglaciecola sp. CAU 1673]